MEGWWRVVLGVSLNPPPVFLSIFNIIIYYYYYYLSIKKVKGGGLKS